MRQLKTRWSDKIDREHVLEEYPRPLMRRNSYINLNGMWDYAITGENRMPEKYDGPSRPIFPGVRVIRGKNS